MQAYAAARMAESCLLGLEGKDNIYECAYVQSSIVPGVEFFASKVRGHGGMCARQHPTHLSLYSCRTVEKLELSVWCLASGAANEWCS